MDFCSTRLLKNSPPIIPLHALPEFFGRDIPEAIPARFLISAEDLSTNYELFQNRLQIPGCNGHLRLERSRRSD